VSNKQFRFSGFWIVGTVLLNLLLTSCVQEASGLNPLALRTPTGSLDNPEFQETPENQKNPFDGNQRQARQGEILYQASCASCHGDTGEGDGQASSSLDPPPGNLADRVNGLTDLYLYWRIADGGLMEPFNSLMPSWRGILSEEQIWQVITFLRTFGD
jgi:mono/diheme cytochrome c family protein